MQAALAPASASSAYLFSETEHKSAIPNGYAISGKRAMEMKNAKTVKSAYLTYSRQVFESKFLFEANKTAFALTLENKEMKFLPESDKRKEIRRKNGLFFSPFFD